MGADASECHQVDGSRGLAQEFGSCPQDQKPRKELDAHDFSVCGEVGTDGQESHQTGSGEGWDEAPQDASRSCTRGVRVVGAADPGTLPENGPNCWMPGPSRERDRRATVAGFRFYWTHAADSTRDRSRLGGDGEDRGFTEIGRASW